MVKRVQSPKLELDWDKIREIQRDISDFDFWNLKTSDIATIHTDLKIVFYGKDIHGSEVTAEINLFEFADYIQDCAIDYAKKKKDEAEQALSHIG